jgi:hypothetical protein
MMPSPARSDGSHPLVAPGATGTVHARPFFHNFCEYAVKTSIHPYAGTAPTRFALRCSSSMAGATLRRGRQPSGGWSLEELLDRGGTAAGAGPAMNLASVSARRKPGGRRLVPASPTILPGDGSAQATRHDAAGLPAKGSAGGGGVRGGAPMPSRWQGNADTQMQLAPMLLGTLPQPVLRQPYVAGPAGIDLLDRWLGAAAGSSVSRPHGQVAQVSGNAVFLPLSERGPPAE